MGLYGIIREQMTRQVVCYLLYVLHNTDYVATAVFLQRFLYYKPHSFHTLTVLVTGGYNINTSCVYTAMT